MGRDHKQISQMRGTECAANRAYQQCQLPSIAGNGGYPISMAEVNGRSISFACCKQVQAESVTTYLCKEKPGESNV